MKTNFHSLNISEALKNLESSKSGLTTKEAEKRLKKYGPNEFSKEKKFSTLKLLISQFKDPLIYILIIAFAISLATGHLTDASVIFVVIIISTVVSFIQEYKANEALSKLKSLIEFKAKVIRNGKEHVILQTEVVPGDIIILNQGDKIPADSRIIEYKNLEINEAPLTGESLPIEKTSDPFNIGTSLAERKNMVYLGTVVVRGTGKALVVATGKHTEIGNIAKLVGETAEVKTPLQKQLLKFSQLIGIFLVILNLLIFTFGIITGKPLFEMFLVSVSMLVAGIPEGLLPAMTVILSVGVQKLAKKNGLVRKMIATETLGSVSVICSDKTGTLTEGEMRVVEIITETENLKLNGEKLEKKFDITSDASHIKALKIGVLCNNAIIENLDEALKNTEIIGNPTEKALILAGLSTGIHKDELEKNERRINEIPFESEYKYMVTSHSYGKDSIASYMKGAPEIILKFCNKIDIEGKYSVLTDKKTKEIIENYENYTRKGLRVIAVAEKIENEKTFNKDSKDDQLKDFVFVGLIVLKDPLRKEAKETIELCQSAGIRPIIITGDHKLTAMAIVSDMGILVKEENVMEGKDLENIDDLELKKIINNIYIFARVEPKHKLRIVEALQANNEIVAMTGDGINDAPALKKADIGVALGSGTDVAKETSDLVLLDDNFKTIVEAIKRGRAVFDNIRKVVLYLLSNSLNEVFLITFSLIFGLPLALIPVQILWINMIEDSFPAIALAFDPVNKNAMQLPPRDPKEQILNSGLKKLLIFFILFADTILFSIFYWAFSSTGNPAYAQTITFVGLGIASRFYVFSIRGLTQPIYKYNPFNNNWVNISTIFGFAMILVAIYVPFFNKILKTVPIGVKEWLILGTYAFLTIGIYELGKLLFVYLPKKRKLNFTIKTK